MGSQLDLPARSLETRRSEQSLWSNAGTRWTVGLALLLVIGPLLWRAIPREISRWYQAAAQEAELDGRLDDAVANMEAALRWHPNNTVSLAYRSQLHLRRHELDAALDDANRAVESAASEPLSIVALIARSLALQRLGRHDDAIRDADAVVQIVATDAGHPWTLPSIAGATSIDYADVLNQRAYFRALGQRQLDEGLADIEKAIKLRGSDDDYALLDTRGYLHYLRGEYGLAEADMERAVTLLEAQRKKFEEASKEAQGRWNRGELEHLRKQLQESRAVLYQHRGMVYEKMGRAAEAAADLRLAKELGYDPDKGVW